MGPKRKKKKSRVTGFAGREMDAAEWLEKKRYPKPGSAGTDRDEDALHKDTGTPVAKWIVEALKIPIMEHVDEFVCLDVDEVSTKDHGEKDRGARDRFPDVVLSGRTRVVLDDGLPGDYIHASYVDGYYQKRAYISTQAPTVGTAVDFWRMIWQEKTLVIVMLTKLEECAEEKCSVYWPGRQGTRYRYGPFRLTAKKVQHRSTYSATEIEMRDLRDGKKRIVVHFLFTDWPDHSIPEQPTAFQHFMERVREIQHIQTKRLLDWKGSSNGPPIVIHCSAGIGRTGTFQAIDISFRRYIASGLISIQDTVKKLRKQRTGSVQSQEQYLFIYGVVLHILKTDNHLKPEMFPSIQEMVRKWKEQLES